MYEIDKSLLEKIDALELSGRNQAWRAAMKAAGYDYMSLAVIKKNEEALKFWNEQGFRVVEETVSTDGYEVYVLERDI